MAADNKRAGLLVLLTAGMAAGSAIFAIFLLNPGDRLSDVGELEGLRGVQARLQPLDACGIDYNMHIRQRDGKIRVKPCDDLPYVIFPVPTDWPYRQLSFSIQRSSRDKRWAIRVDKNRVAFPDLVAALESVTPNLAAEYPAALAATAERQRKGRADIKAIQEERRQASERARDSYPSK